MLPAGAPHPLLRDIALDVAPNTLGLIFGRSGAGKTTLLQVIAGLAEQSSGGVSFSGPLPEPHAAAGRRPPLWQPRLAAAVAAGAGASADAGQQ